MRPGGSSGRRSSEKRTNTPDGILPAISRPACNNLYRASAAPPSPAACTRCLSSSYEDASIPTRRKALADALIAAFSDLNPDEQAALLDNSDWPGIRRPAMLPHLRRLWAAAAYPEDMGFEF